MKIDLNKRLPYTSDYAHTILLNGVIEHIDNLLGLLTECKRVLKSGGVLIIISPHFTNCHYHSDLTHKRPTSYLMFFTLCSNHPYNSCELKIRKIRLLFSKGKMLWDYVIEPIANKFPTFYEYSPLKIFQCYDVYVEMIKESVVNN